MKVKSAMHFNGKTPSALRFGYEMEEGSLYSRSEKTGVWRRCYDVGVWDKVSDDDAKELEVAFQLWLRSAPKAELVAAGKWLTVAGRCLEEGIIKHGTSGGYCHHKCRCVECRAWNAANQKRHYKRHGRGVPKAKIEAFIRKLVKRVHEYEEAIEPAWAEGKKFESRRYEGIAIGTRWAYEDLNELL